MLKLGFWVDGSVLIIKPKDFKNNLLKILLTFLRFYVLSRLATREVARAFTFW